LVPKTDPLGRLFWLSRLLWLAGGDPKTLADVVREAERAKAWPDLAAIYVRLAAAAQGPPRLEHYRALAALLEERLANPTRAYLTLQAIGIEPGTHTVVLEALGRLAEATGRHEDYLAVLEAQAGAGFAVDARQQVIRTRAAVCETKLDDAERAFQEQRRLLDLDPADQAARKELHRLAEKRGLWRQLDAVYGELWDRAGTAADRIDIARTPPRDLSQPSERSGRGPRSADRDLPPRSARQRNPRRALRRRRGPERVGASAAGRRGRAARSR
jgi:golgin subfamily B member 1